MKKFLSSILVVFLLLLSSCSNKGYYTFNFKAYTYNTNKLWFKETNSYFHSMMTFKNLSYEKYNIDYIFAGDEIIVTCEQNVGVSIFPEWPNYVEFYNIQNIKIKRAPIINLIVSTYKENGVEYKKIVANNKKIILDKEYTNQDEIIFTGQTDLKNITYTDEYKYTYETLGDLKDGTRLSATYYKEDGITHIYAFYLRSYVNKVKYFSI